MAQPPALLLTLLLIVIPVIDNVSEPILVARAISTPMLVTYFSA
jgi:hypothetical protein